MRLFSSYSIACAPHPLLITRSSLTRRSDGSIVGVEGVDGGLQAILHLVPAALAAPGGEGVNTLGDGDDGERVALVGVCLGDVLGA